MTQLELEIKFKQYWDNRNDRGWHSQFEEKYDAALSAWIDGWRQGFTEAIKITLGQKGESPLT